jgi:hypothetical protein
MTAAAVAVHRWNGRGQHLTLPDVQRDPIRSAMAAALFDTSAFRIIIRAMASPITTVVKWVLARQSDGMIEASATRSAAMPFTAPSGFTTPLASLNPAMRQEPAAC